MVIDTDKKTFVVHVALLILKTSIYLASSTPKTLIHLTIKGLVVLLNLKEASGTIPIEYSEYANISASMYS